MKEFIKEYINIRGGVENLKGTEKEALTTLIEGLSDGGFLVPSAKFKKLVSLGSMFAQKTKQASSQKSGEKQRKEIGLLVNIKNDIVEELEGIIGNAWK